MAEASEEELDLSNHGKPMHAMPSIWPQHEVFYIESMLFHTRQAILSIEYVADLIQKIDEHIEARHDFSFDCSLALDHLQRIRHCSAALSRYFWPARKPHESRGAFLRTAFRIAENSPLRNRGLRDASEHFDERLDKYLSSGISGVVMPEWFGLTTKDDVPAHYFRAYFIDSDTFKILGEEFRVQPISSELVRLHNRLLYFLDHGGRLSKMAD